MLINQLFGESIQNWTIVDDSKTQGILINIKSFTAQFLWFKGEKNVNIIIE